MSLLEATAQKNEAGPFLRSTTEMQHRRQKLADIVSLAKPRLSSFVVFSAASGLYLSGAQFSFWRALTIVASIAGTVAAANALNCYLERDSDLKMERTSTRPLPQKRLSARLAMWLGIAVAAISIPSLWFFGNGLAACLGLVAFVSYVFAYTPMKARSHWAMWVGAVPGALPPVMGYVAGTGRFDLASLWLFWLLFFWQMPHFLAIALFRKAEYRRAGLKSVPLARGDRHARLESVLHVVLLVVPIVGLYAAGVSGVWFASVAFVATLGFAVVAIWGAIQADNKSAKRLFFFSLLYLVIIFSALMVNAQHDTHFV